MANHPIIMNKLRQVLKLHCQGQGKLKIAETIGMSRNTVKKYIGLFIKLEVNLDELTRLTYKELDALFNSGPEPTMPLRLLTLYRYFHGNKPFRYAKQSCTYGNY